MSRTLIATKLFRPVQQREILHRARLIARLNDGLNYRLILISAPAGFGKTTLLADWLQEADLRSSWLTLDVDDDDPLRFLHYLIAALDAVEPGFGAALHETLTVTPTLPIKAIITRLINEIAAALPRSILVLDDYQCVESGEIHEAVAFLVEHLPPNLHLVLATRSDPQLPLTRMRANKQIFELRAADLRFTPDETAAFLNGIMDLNIPSASVEALGERTEGWIASLQLAALALRGRNDVEEFITEFTGSHSYIVDYLSEEVLQQQSPEVQRFLLQTSILRNLYAPLCDAVTGSNDSNGMLDYLRRSNLFLVARDDQHDSYRYHNLFRDLMRYRMERSDPELARELHRRAALWLREQGMMEEALEHAIAAGDYTLAADMVEEEAVHMLMQGDVERLKKGIGLIPSAVRADYPYLNLGLAAIAGTSGGQGVMPMHLAAAEKAMQGPRGGAYDERMLAHFRQRVSLLRTYHAIAYRSGRMEDQRRILDDILEMQRQLLPDDDPLVISVVHGLAGEFHALLNNPEEARKAFQVAIAVGTQSDNLYIALASVRLQAQMQIIHGKLRQAWNLCQRADDDLREHGMMPGSPLFSYLFGPIGRILYERNDLVGASEYLEQAMELAEQLGNLSNILHVGTACLWMRQIQGRSSDAQALMDKLFDTAQQSAAEFWTPHLETWQVRLWLAQNRIHAAERWAARYRSIRDPELVFHIEREFAYVRILIATREYSDALELLDELCEAAVRGGLFIWIVRGLLLRSIVHRAKGAAEDAFADLERALSLAEPEGHIRLVVDEGEMVTEMLVKLLSRNERSAPISNTYITTLLAAANRPAQPRRGELLDPLTDREIEVLRLLASGFSNAAIAEHLFVAVGTVKKHTHSIYSKLNVANRLQAVRRAQELRML